MMALPAASWSYAVRTAVTALLLAAFWWPSIDRTVYRLARRDRKPWADLALGLGLGILVLLVWIAPDGWGWYRRWCVVGNPYGGENAAMDSLMWVRFLGSALVISAAEELFFRKWLIGFAGFWWMVALFALEHNRWLVGAIAGVLYGFIYLKRGTFAAIVAHATTNLLLGLYVLQGGHWEFWR